MKIKAAVWGGPGERALIETVTLDPPGPGEVLVRVVAAGVCHSDLHLALGHLGTHRFPIVLGHEGAGLVEAVGAGVSHVSPGDPVTFCFIPSCGRCRQCQRGRSNLCETGTTAAFSGTMADGSRRLHRADGADLLHFLGVAAFAELAVVQAGSVVPVPPGLPLAEAALVGCAVLTGFGAVRNAARVAPGDSVCVIGCGGVGLQVITACRLAGAARIVAVDPVPEKRELARRHGATETAAPEELEGTFDYAFEVVGRAETIQQAWSAIGPGGTAVVVGIAPIGVKAAISAVDFSDDKTLRGSFYGSGNPAVEAAELAQLAADRVFDLGASVTHTCDLAGINEAFDRMQRGEGARTVVLIDP